MAAGGGESFLLGICYQIGYTCPRSIHGSIPMLTWALLRGIFGFKNKAHEIGREMWWEKGKELEGKEWG